MPETVLNDTYGLLEPGGRLFIDGSSLILSQYKITTRKNELISQLQIKYIGPSHQAGDSTCESSDTNLEKDLFPNSKFAKSEKQIYQTKVVWKVDQKLGNLYSMSWAGSEYFGNKLTQFEDEFKHSLGHISKQRDFTNQVQYIAYFFDQIDDSFWFCTLYLL